MISPRRLILTSLSALTLAASLQLSTGCRKSESGHSHGKTTPEAFTAKLTEIDGVQMIYTFRHPKLINQELEKLMTEIPEAALARMFLGQLVAFGYPEFSEIAAGSNIGVALLEVTAEEIAASKPTLVGFAKLKEDGKIWTLLAQSGMTLQKQGDWVMVSQDPAAFAKVKNPTAVISHIEQSQDEEIRAWGRVSPAVLAAAKEALFPQLEAKLAERTPEEQKAARAYAEVVWDYVAQLHSAGGYFDLSDKGIALGYHGQFLPDSAVGKFLRYEHGPAPKIADSVPADAVVSAVIRQNIPGQLEFVTGFLDALIAVDYPAGSAALKDVKTAYVELSKDNDGGAVVTFDMDLTDLGQQPEVDMFAVYTGHYDAATITNAYKKTSDLSKQFTDLALQTALSGAPDVTTQIDQELNENALTIDGVNFGSVVTTTKINLTGEDVVSSTTQYFGVVNGMLVISTNEDRLRANLPAIAAKKSVSNPVKISLSGDEMGVMVLHGEKLVDTALKGVTLDTNDADVQAQLKALKEGFASADPVKATLEAGQAKSAIKISIPYKFISQTMRLFQFASAYKAAPTDGLGDMQPVATPANGMEE